MRPTIDGLKSALKVVLRALLPKKDQASKAARREARSAWAGASPCVTHTAAHTSLAPHPPPPIGARNIATQFKRLCKGLSPLKVMTDEELEFNRLRTCRECSDD